MRRRIVTAIACIVGLGVAPARAADPQPTAPPAPPTASADQPEGWQLMTPEERAAHCTAMRAAKTPEERAQLRAAHHAQMVARAEQRGVPMPPQPPMGMGPGAGCAGMGGSGMGAGMGMGPGAQAPPTP